MKNLLLSLALTFSSVAAADSAKIFEVRNWGASQHDVTTTFQVNEELGRAWVNVSIADRSFEDTTYDDHRVKLAGLSLNAEKTAVVLEQDGALVDCATVTPKRGIFGRRNLIIRSTGRCTFEPKVASVEVDNGFEIRKVRVLQVFMNVQ
ncbi:MAG: hypothetical protein V4598_12925 [Bdellovibrionota bacterium]